MKDKLTGTHIVILVGLVLGALIALVALGQEFGALIAGVVAILSLLGYNTAQNRTNNELANGRLTALQNQLTEKDRLHAEENARKDAQFAMERAGYQAHIKEANDKVAMYAAMAPPDAKVE